MKGKNSQTKRMTKTEKRRIKDREGKKGRQKKDGTKN